MKGTPISPTVCYGIGSTRTMAVVVLAVLFALWNRTAQKSGDVPYSTPIRLVASDGISPATSDDLPASRSATRVIRIGFAGDIMQHRGQAGDDFGKCYGEVRPLLESFDLAVGNLEFPVCPGRPVGPPARSVQFNGSPENVTALSEAGFDVLCTANNHSFDQGLEGVVSTLDTLRSNGITPVGTAADKSECGPVVVECQGLRIALVAYTILPNSYPQDDEIVAWPRHWPVFELNFLDWSDEYREKGRRLFAAHSEAAAEMEADFLIALVHWGEEWDFAPSDDQRRAARDLVDAGFDLVVGGHSHVINPAEVYRGKLIAYSLGNFISDFQDMATRLGAVLEVTIDPGRERPRVIDFCYHPILTERSGHIVHPLQPNEPGEGGRAWKLAERILGPSLTPFSTAKAPASQPANMVSRTEK